MNIKYKAQLKLQAALNGIEQQEEMEAAIMAFDWRK